MISWPDRGRKRGYWVNIALGIDQGAGTWFGIDADECISSYVGRELYHSWQRIFIDWIFLKLTGEKDHCLKSIETLIKESVDK